MKYVDFNRDVAREMWGAVSVQLSNFTPVKAMVDGIAIVGTIDIDCVYELNEDTAVQIVVVSCQLIVDPEVAEFSLMPGLSLSPELRAVLTMKLTRMLDSELEDAIRECANWLDATNGAPEGFVGESYEPDAEASDEEPVTAVVDPSTSDDNPY